MNWREKGAETHSVIFLPHSSARFAVVRIDAFGLRSTKAAFGRNQTDSNH